MSMPRNLLLVRHGQSEENLANALALEQRESLGAGDFFDTHNSKVRLTKNGVIQAASTADWFKAELDKIDESFATYFDRAVVSSYARAMETAALIEPDDEDAVEGIEWRTSFTLRARSWGDMEKFFPSQRKLQHPDYLIKQQDNPFHWTPPNGESMADLCMRIHRLYDQLHERCDGMNVIIVCHRDVMWAFRILLEEMSAERFKELCYSSDPKDRIHNAHVLHYSRMNPHMPQKGMEPRMNWMRSICPHNPELSSNEWQKIAPYRPRKDDLLAAVAQFPRMFGD